MGTAAPVGSREVRLLAQIDATAGIDPRALTPLRELLGDRAHVLIDGPRLVVELHEPVAQKRRDVERLAERIAETVAELRRLPGDVGSIGYVGWHAGADAGLLAAAERDSALAAVVAVRPRLQLVLPRLSSVAAPTLLIADRRDPWLLGRRALRRLPAASSLLRRPTATEADARAVELIAAAWIERFAAERRAAAPKRPHLNRRLRRRLAKLAPAAVVAAGAIAATGSSASSGCAAAFETEAGILTITCSGEAGEAFTLSHLDGEILLDGSKTGAKLAETTLVQVFGTPAGDKATIDETSGPFALPFELDFKAGDGDQLTYLGQKAAENSLLLDFDTLYLRDGLGTIKLHDADLVEIKLGEKNDLVDAGAWKLTDLKLYGEAGDDVLLGGSNADLLSGGPGLNKLVGGEGEDLLLEEIVASKFFDASSFKLLTTPDGSFLEALDGTEATQSKIELIEAAELKLLDDVGYKLDATEWTLTDLKLIGGPGGDTFIGGIKGETILAGLGDDLISAGPGVNVVDGGEGEDRLLEDLSFAKFETTSFKLETLADGSYFKALESKLLTESKIALVEQADLKWLDQDRAIKLDATTWELADLKLLGGPLADTLLGSKANDVILAAAGDDLLSAGAGVNLVDGGAGSDLLLEEVTSSKLFEATSFKLETTLEGSFLKSLDGTEATQSKIELIESAELKFLDEVDYKLDVADWRLSELKLYGGPGDDTFIGGFKLALLDGGAGLDLLSEEISFAKFGATDFKLVTRDDGSFLRALDGSLLEAKTAGLESVELKFLDEVGYKLDVADWKMSELKLYGGPGDDTFIGGYKLALLDGGAGLDLLREDLTASKFFGATSFKLETTLDGSFLKSLDGTEATESKIALIEAAELKFLDDVGYKLDATEWKLTDLKLIGGAGADTFLGGIKGETILAGLGDDLVAAGPGINKLDGGGGVDTVQETLSSAVFGTTSFALSGNSLKAGTDTLTEFSDFDVLGFEFADAVGYKLDASTFTHAIKLEGGDGPDTFIGSKFADLLLGGGGVDSVNGGPGDDKIGGGPGNDSLAGETGVDVLVETGDVSFKLTNTLLTGLGQDVLSGFEAAILTGGDHDNVLDASGFKAGAVTLLGLGSDDVLVGTSFGDLLRGGDGDDELAARSGNDKLFGELGDDALDGGAGTDFGDAGPGNNTCKSIEQPFGC